MLSPNYPHPAKPANVKQVFIPALCIPPFFIPNRIPVLYFYQISHSVKSALSWPNFLKSKHRNSLFSNQHFSAGRAVFWLFFAPLKPLMSALFTLHFHTLLPNLCLPVYQCTPIPPWRVIKMSYLLGYTTYTTPILYTLSKKSRQSRQGRLVAKKSTLSTLTTHLLLRTFGFTLFCNIFILYITFIYIFDVYITFFYI